MYLVISYPLEPYPACRRDRTPGSHLKLVSSRPWVRAGPLPPGEYCFLLLKNPSPARRLLKALRRPPDAAIRSRPQVPFPCREVRADWGLITENTPSACVRCKKDAQRPCSAARSTPRPTKGFWQAAARFWPLGCRSVDASARGCRDCGMRYFKNGRVNY